MRCKNPSLSRPTVYSNFGFVGRNFKIWVRIRFSLKVSDSVFFLIVLGLREEKGIIRLRKRSAGWAAAPTAQEEYYVG